ncbi:MAG: ABC transporter ATP-binding protein [Defluviitaleaceae bacterium]|nr:ABC transporter ATP-binding protein [Defluviitaleaceae bacterium]
MINMSDIVKKYFIGTENEITVLKGVGLNIQDGEFVAIVGQSGSGKSTLMNIIGALDRPTEGQYLLDGTAIEDMDDGKLSDVRNQKIGFVFQNFYLIPRTSALTNVEMPLLYRGVGKKARHDRAVKMLELVEMGERMHHMPNELSGGQQQRVAIARALVNEPSVILADEPTGALDTKTGNHIMDIFTKINREEKRTVVLITHNNQLAQLTDRVITISDGEIISDIKTGGGAANL